jgi:hypothetical protein
MKKLSIEWLRDCFSSGGRFDHPARKDFTLQPKALRGVFHPNPLGCKGIRNCLRYSSP